MFQEGRKGLFSILYSQSLKISAISCFRNLYAIDPRVTNYSNLCLVKVESGFMGSTVKQLNSMLNNIKQIRACLTEACANMIIVCDSFQT